MKQKDLLKKREDTKTKSFLSGKGNIFWKEKIKKKNSSQFIYKIGYTISD